MDGVVMQKSVLGYGNGASPAFRQSKRGELVGVDFLTQLSLDGRLYNAVMGTASTPVDFAKTAYDADQPQFVVDVPTGVTILPLNLLVMFETQAGTINEIIVGVAATLAGSGTSTAVVPQTLCTHDAALATGCSVRSLYTGNSTDMTTAGNGYAIIGRYGNAFADTKERWQSIWTWSALKDGNMPKLKGPACFVVHIAAGTTAPTGYLTFTWAEFSSDEI